MKNTFLKSIDSMTVAILLLTAALAILLLAAFAQITASAQDAQSEGKFDEQTEASLLQTEKSLPGFVGTWDVTVTIRNCQTYAPIRSFASVTTFMFGGTLIDSTSGTPQSRKTPGHGVWKNAGGNTYNFSFKVLNFDASGNYTGWQIVRHTAYLDPLRDEFFSRGTSEVFDPNGNLILTGCSSTTARRFE